MESHILPIDFYNRPTLTVARELLGMLLVCTLDNVRLSGKIVETEAYIGEQDLGCHAKAGKTPRTSIMYGRAGIAYVYFTYGMHWCLNAVTEEKGFPAAVLIRAVQPVDGVEIISERRRGRDTNGPAKLTQAFGITGAQNGLDMTDPRSDLWIETGQAIPDSSVTETPRVGLNNVPEPWKSKPWRFMVMTLPQ